ncbi:alcohol dehydrogenase catalytic domain-containing protein [Amycolatopsis saalfeldensis]|uniref:alcohol dehydrogenase catalytic domain-containing protein n=1 Tax=Amycolatopsis saalfeldensis TaxID=394193 RepID=UPI000B82E1C2
MRHRSQDGRREDGAGLALPVVIGHEIAGEVVSTSDGFIPPGTRVARHSCLTCGRCASCARGTTTPAPTSPSSDSARVARTGPGQGGRTRHRGRRGRARAQRRPDRGRCGREVATRSAGRSRRPTAQTARFPWRTRRVLRVHPGARVRDRVHRPGRSRTERARLAWFDLRGRGRRAGGRRSRRGPRIDSVYRLDQVDDAFTWLTPGAGPRRDRALTDLREHAGCPSPNSLQKGTVVCLKHSPVLRCP